MLLSKKSCKQISAENVAKNITTWNTTVEEELKLQQDNHVSQEAELIAFTKYIFDLFVPSVSVNFQMELLQS